MSQNGSPHRAPAVNDFRMFEQVFRNIDDALRKEAGCATELDYAEQTSWLLFLKYLDGLEEDLAIEAALQGKSYTSLLEPRFCWSTWAAPKDSSTGSGQAARIDHNKALTGDDLRDFVNQQVFPYLQKFKERVCGPDTIEYKIGEIFGELKNKITRGYNPREIIDHVEELRFSSQTEKHEMSALYEEKIKRMGNAGRNGGEYYTPHWLTRAMIRVVNPRLGETIDDGACGSAGFLCEVFDYLRSTGSRTGRSLSTAKMKALQEHTLRVDEVNEFAHQPFHLRGVLRRFVNQLAGGLVFQNCAR